MEQSNINLFSKYIEVYENLPVFHLREHVDLGTQYIICFTEEPTEDDMRPFIKALMSSNYDDLHFDNAHAILAVHEDRVEFQTLFWDPQVNACIVKLFVGAEVDEILQEAYNKLIANRLNYLNSIQK